MFDIPGAKRPSYDVRAMRAATAEAPVWAHFGAGNIFRAYIAFLQNELLDRGLTNKGIIAAECFDTEIIEKIYRPHDNAILLATLFPGGGTGLSLAYSVADALSAVPGTPDYEKLGRVFEAPSLQMVSLTITEKGYSGPAMDILSALLRRRFQSCAAPLALVSMDNCARNGELLRQAVLDASEGPGFLKYLSDPQMVSFPWTMIDKITPAPSEAVRKTLPEPDLWTPVRTAKGTVIAPFANAEAPQYLVIEDDFPNGRLPLEQAGVRFAGRETVMKAERMKVTACLNPLHTALAVFGCLFGVASISECMKDADLSALVRRLGYDEGLPAVEHPGIFEPEEFLDEVLERRLVNPFLPDTPRRIAADTSRKLPFRFGETIKTYMARDSVDSLTAVPLVLAGWTRYLLGVDDNGEYMAVSPDPMMSELTEAMKEVRFGHPGTAKKAGGVFGDARWFGVDLYEAGLGTRCEGYLAQMLRGAGSARQTLRENLTDAPLPPRR